MCFTVPPMAIMEDQMRRIVWTQPHAQQLFDRRPWPNDRPDIELFHDRPHRKEIQLRRIESVGPVSAAA
jgi:hypothetical protein